MTRPGARGDAGGRALRTGRGEVARGGRPPRSRAALVALGLGALGLVAVWALWRPGGIRGRPPAASVAAMSESLEVARKDQRWAASVAWARRIADARPGSSPALRNLSAAWHNWAKGARPVAHAPAPALRNSLQRVAAEQQALACADSAWALAATDAERASAALAAGQIYEALSLPQDALQIYAAVPQRPTGDPQAARLAYWLREHLRDPRLPDVLPPPGAR